MCGLPFSYMLTVLGSQQLTVPQRVSHTTCLHSKCTDVHAVVYAHVCLNLCSFWMFAYGIHLQTIAHALL